MNMITKLATRLLATLSIVGMLSTPAAAQGLNTSDMALAFEQAPQTARSMSTVEMNETEGEFAAHAIKGVKAVFDAGKAAYQAKKAAKAAEKAAKSGKKEHTTNQRPSNLEKHQNGQARAKRDQGHERGDRRREW
jgi:hypothetical protein